MMLEHQAVELALGIQEYHFRLAIIRGIGIGSVILLCLAGLGLLFLDYFDE